MVQRDFNQNYHCIYTAHFTSNTIKMKLIFSKTKFDHKSFVYDYSLLSLCSHLVDFVRKQLKILSSIDNC